MKKNIFYSIAIIGSTFINTSCTDEVSIDDGINIEENVTEEISEDLFESPDVDYQLPSAIQVASIFKKSGLKFNESAMNSTENAINYTSSKSQMLNFGVYSADIAYCVMNNQSDKARELIGVISDLADVQGMAAVFDNKDLMERFDKNIENPDSVQYIMMDIHERTEEYMSENDMMHTSAVHYAGAWVEGMFLGVFDYENNNENKNVGAQITEQMEILRNIIKGLKDPKNSEVNLEDVILSLENIQTTYNNFESVKVFINDDSAVELNLNKDEFSQISTLIKDIRTKIING